MDSFKRGLSFYKQVWLMVRQDRRLLLPLGYIFAAWLVCVLLGSLLISGTLALFRYSFLGWFVAGFWCILVLFTLESTGELLSVLVIHLMNAHLTGAVEPVSQAWTVLRKGWLDILGEIAAAPLANILQDLLILWKKPGRLHDRLSAAATALAGEGSWLALPAMVMGLTSFKDGLQWASQVARDQRLPIRINRVGVNRVNQLAGILLGGGGILLSVVLRLSLVHATAGSALAKFAATGMCVWIACVFILMAVLITSYTTSAYMTCLYLWVKSSEQSREPVAAPAPLAVALA